MRALALALFLLVASPAFATTIDPLTWEQLVVGADLVGVVECVTAGEIVARYKVVEPWKGAEKNALVTIRTPPDRWGPKAPTALVGERFLVTAFRRPPSTMMSTTIGPGTMLTWRTLDADFELPLFQGQERLPFEPTVRRHRKQGVFGSPFHDEASFTTAARALIAKPKTEQLARQLEALCTKYLNSERTKAASEGLLAALAKSRTAEASLDALFAYERSVPDSMRTVKRLLGQVSGIEAVLPRVKSSAKSEAARQMLIELRELPRERPDLHTEPKAIVPDAAMLGTWRAALANPDGGAAEFDEAFFGLVQHDCGAVAKWIAAKPTEKDERLITDLLLGASFAASCAQDRVANLTKTADTAKAAYVRVASAVYLAFDDLDAALPRLTAQMRLPGGPGAWAALSLARRGEKAALTRLLAALKETPSEFFSGSELQRFQKRIAVLLSNSAAASKVPPPKLPPGGEWTVDYAAGVEAWWKEHETRVTLTDPWLPELEKNKQD